MDEDFVEPWLFTAVVDAVRQIGGDAFVAVVSNHAGGGDIPRHPEERVPLAEYLSWRDAALHFLGDSFHAVAFEAGRMLGRRQRRNGRDELEALCQQLTPGYDKLLFLGQATVVAARKHPGRIRCLRQGTDELVVTINACLECRGLRWQRPSCGLYLGLVTELAEGFLGLKVAARETACIAIGDSLCQIEVRRR